MEQLLVYRNCGGVLKDSWFQNKAPLHPSITRGGEPACLESVMGALSLSCAASQAVAEPQLVPLRRNLHSVKNGQGQTTRLLAAAPQDA